jgi:hypothetical protein
MVGDARRPVDGVEQSGHRLVAPLSVRHHRIPWFTPGRDEQMKPQPPMTQIIMDTASRPARPEGRHPDLQLLRDCLALSDQRVRPSARIRLEEAVGAEFARKLLTSLTLSSRR